MRRAGGTKRREGLGDIREGDLVRRGELLFLLLKGHLGEMFDGSMLRFLRAFSRTSSGGGEWERSFRVGKMS